MAACAKFHPLIHSQSWISCTRLDLAFYNKIICLYTTVCLTLELWLSHICDACGHALSVAVAFMRQSVKLKSLARLLGKHWLPIASYSTSFGFQIICWSRKPHPSQMRLARLQSFAWKNGKLLEGSLRRALSYCLQPFRKFQGCQVCGWGPCMGVRRAMVAMSSHGWKKKWSGLNRTGLEYEWWNGKWTGTVNVHSCR